MTPIAIAAIPPLLAADAWSTIIGLLIFIFWSALQWLSSRNEAQQQKPRRPRPPQPVDRAAGQMPGQLPPDRFAPDQLRPDQLRRDQMRPGQLPRDQGVPGDEVAQAPRNQEDALRSEVEAFLRRAQGHQAQGHQAQGHAQEQPQPKPPSRPEQRQQPARAQPQQYADQPRTLVNKAPQEQPSGRPGRPQRESMEGRDLRSEGVAEHVAKHLSTQDIAAHSMALGEAVGLTDERLESRLHEKFDHNLGSLTHRDKPADIKPTAKTIAAADIATEIFDMLREPAGIRKLIVANEILRRPEW